MKTKRTFNKNTILLLVLISLVLMMLGSCSKNGKDEKTDSPKEITNITSENKSSSENNTNSYEGYSGVDDDDDDDDDSDSLFYNYSKYKFDWQESVVVIDANDDCNSPRPENLTAEIVDGNILIKQGGDKFLVLSNNAKYLDVAYHGSCLHGDLLYIDENNVIYFTFFAEEIASSYTFKKIK